MKFTDKLLSLFGYEFMPKCKVISIKYKSQDYYEGFYIPSEFNISYCDNQLIIHKQSNAQTFDLEITGYFVEPLMEQINNSIMYTTKGSAIKTAAHGRKLDKLYYLLLRSQNPNDILEDGMTVKTKFNKIIKEVVEP